MNVRDEKPVNTGHIQDGKFKPGQSGNPAGKPKGARHKTTLAAMELLEGEAEALTRKAIEQALQGDSTALRICMERIVPTYKSTAPPIDIPLTKPESLMETAMDFLRAAASGELPPDLAAQLVSAVANVSRIEDTENLKDRLNALEKAIKEQK